MKKTIIIILILASIIFMSIYNFLDVNNKCNLALKETKIIEQNLSQNNLPFLKYEAKNLKYDWDYSSNILQLFLKRENLKLLEKEILNLNNNLEEFNINKLKKNIKQLYFYCDEIKKQSDLSISNIL